jgi:acyl carrier protein
MELHPGPTTGPDEDVAALVPSPNSSIESEVAAIWADVLELDAVRPDDDFFELGGDSLSAVQILARITRKFNYKVTEGELFTARTVRGLAQVVSQSVRGSSDGGPQLAPIAGPRTRFPATAAQRRLWILDHIQPGGLQRRLPGPHAGTDRR